VAHAVRTWPGRLVARPWILAFVPVNAATSGFGIVLPLLILISLHGAWTEVALAATLFNGAVILSSLLWGWVSDHYPYRRVLLAVNFAGYAVVYTVLADVHSLPSLLVLYTLVGVLAPAGTSASNLLILEKFGTSERPSAYASFQLLSMVGSVVGLLVGYFWLEAAQPLGPLLFVLAALAAASAAAVVLWVREPKRTLTTAHVGHHVESLASRLRPSSLHISIPFFPVRPSLGAGALRRFVRWTKAEVRHELPLILAAMFLFNLSANLFNISYTPYLVSVGIGAASIFLVNLANNAGQALVYPASGSLTARLGADSLVQRSTYLRGVGYLAVAGLTFAPLAAIAALTANLVAYAILGIAIAFYTTASSILLFRAVEGKEAGRLIGLSSALGGAAAVGGAALSGVLSVFGSFRLVFLVSALGLLVSVPIWTAAAVAYARRHPAPTSPVAVPAPRPPDADLVAPTPGQPT
jgi:MFS family permease